MVKINMEIIPVIHVVDNKQLIANVETCVRCGVNKIFLIDHQNDSRFLPAKADVIKSIHKDLWIGVNMLGYDIKELLINADGFDLLNRTDALWSDEGLTELDMDELRDIEIRNTYEGQFFGGLAFKYQKQPDQGHEVFFVQ